MWISPGIDSVLGQCLDLQAVKKLLIHGDNFSQTRPPFPPSRLRGNEDRKSLKD